MKFQYFNVGQNLGIQSTSVRPPPAVQHNPSVQHNQPPVVSPVISPPKPKQEDKSYNSPYNQSSPFHHQPSPQHNQLSPQPFTEHKSNPTVLPQFGKQVDNVSINNL